ncbi:MAG: hypothetical protein ACPKM0_11085 [Pleomorphochaeta sp.]
MKEKYKKIILLVIFLLFNIFSLFSASEILINDSERFIFNVLGEVSTENYVAVVYYDEELLFNDLTILDNNNQKFDISKPGRTKEFRIVIIGNQLEENSLEVIIEGRKFIGAIGTPEQNYDTELFVNAINPLVNDDNIPEGNIPYNVSLNIPRGVHNLDENIIDVSFVLAWRGNSTLPSGIYTSDIDIEYSVID